MLINRYYGGGATLSVVTEVASLKGDWIKNRTLLIQEVQQKENGVTRITLTDPMSTVWTRWDSDFHFLWDTEGQAAIIV